MEQWRVESKKTQERFMDYMRRGWTPELHNYVECEPWITFEEDPNREHFDVYTTVMACEETGVFEFSFETGATLIEGGGHE